MAKTTQQHAALASLLAGASGTRRTRAPSHSLGNQARLRRIAPPSPVRPGTLQPTLVVGAANDPLEHEADRIADQVMRMPDPALSATPSPPQVSRKCAACEEEDALQRASAEPEEEPAGAAPPIVQEVVGSPGRPLDPAARSFLEPRFGHDFSGVRVHTDGGACSSCQAVNALAYTVGDHLVFGEGRYQPSTTAGRHLLAHELAHVIQQGSAPRLPGAARNARATASGEATVQRETAEPDAGAPEGGVPAAGAPDAGAPDAGAADAGAPAAGAPDGGAAGPAVPAEATAERKCGPDVTGAITAMLGRVEPWFDSLTTFQKNQSCVALGPAAPTALANPIMSWDTRQLFLPNTGWLDTYFYGPQHCGSPRDAACDSDPTRNKCETAGTCGNTVLVDNKCMLAGTANYALFGKMCRICHDKTQRWGRWDMRTIIWLYKTASFDDPGPPLAVATAAYDGTFPSLPAAAENRGTCTTRCGLTHAGPFDFIWEPYRSR